MEISFIKTELEDVYLIKYDKFKDHRGYIFTSYLEEEFVKKGFLPFTHDKFTYSDKNVLRGIHYDQFTTKLVTAVNGEIDQVVVDMRANSKTYKKYLKFNLNSLSCTSVIIPPMVGNAFLVKSDSALYHYKLSYVGNYVDHNQQYTIKWDDPSLNISWGVDNPILSRRDK